MHRASTGCDRVFNITGVVVQGHTALLTTLTLSMFSTCHCMRPSCDVQMSYICGCRTCQTYSGEASVRDCRKRLPRWPRLRSAVERCACAVPWNVTSPWQRHACRTDGTRIGPLVPSPGHMQSMPGDTAFCCPNPRSKGSGRLHVSDSAWPSASSSWVSPCYRPFSPFVCKCCIANTRL